MLSMYQSVLSTSVLSITEPIALLHYLRESSRPQWQLLTYMTHSFTWKICKAKPPIQQMHSNGLQLIAKSGFQCHNFCKKCGPSCHCWWVRGNKTIWQPKLESPSDVNGKVLVMFKIVSRAIWQPKLESQCHSQVMCNGELLVSFHNFIS